LCRPAQSQRKLTKAAGKKTGKDLDALKQELEIDVHKVQIEELYRRFTTDPDRVSKTDVPSIV
jgi:sodium/potassium-transporting ATPase subunit alpha